MNFSKKLSFLIDVTNIDAIYDDIWVYKKTYKVGQQLELFAADKYPVLNVYIKGELVEIVLKREGFIFTTFLCYNEDEVFDASNDIFIPYSADEAMLFQLSTLEDLKWLEKKYIKKFEKIHDAYSLEYTDD